MKALGLVRVVAVVSTGLFAGILLGDRLGATYARPELSASSFVQFQQIVHVHFVRMMPVLVFSSVLAGLVWVALLRSQWRAAEFWLAALATGVMVCVFALTRAVNVPINDQLMTWSITAPPGYPKGEPTTTHKWIEETWPRIA